VRRRQHRGKHYGRNNQRRGGGPVDPVGNHAENLTPVVFTPPPAVEADLRVRLVMELHLDLTRDLTRIGVMRPRK
jgi:hypothetical protein